MSVAMSLYDIITKEASLTSHHWMSEADKSHLTVQWLLKSHIYNMTRDHVTTGTHFSIRAPCVVL